MTHPPLDPGELHRNLEGRRFGHPLIYAERMGSTNDRCLELLEAGSPEGTLVICEEQTHGRGRRARQWLSPPRLGITMTLLLRPSLPATSAPLLAFAAAVGMAGALEKALERPVRIKWPNDLLIEGRKVAGFLAEGRGGTSRPAAVVGVGLNVNHQESDFPPEIRDRVTSLRLASGRLWDRSLLVTHLLARWEEEHEALEAGGSAQACSRWERLSYLLPGDRVRVDLEGTARTGRYLGLGPAGELRIEENGGGPVSFSFGEVARVRGE